MQTRKPINPLALVGPDNLRNAVIVPLMVGLLLGALTLAGCQTQPYDTMGIQIAGHPFRSVPNCHPTKPIGKFDPNCDYPRLGYRGFYDPAGALAGVVGVGANLGQ